MRDAPQKESDTSTSGEVLEEKWVRCVACGERLAPENARMSISGANEHEFMNPAGIRFRVACFATAPGTMPEGDRETVWSWFPGHAWQIALCRACSEHVGWSFHADSGAAFWALITHRFR